MKRLIYLISGLSMAGSLLQAGETKPLDEAFLAALRREAGEQHPAAVAARQRAEAARHEVRSVRRWDDPMVDVSGMKAPRMMRANDGDLMLGFEQALPKPGLYAAMRQRMEAMERAEDGKVEATSLEVAASAARAAIDLALLDEALVLQKAQLDWMREMVRNARQMAADPMGGSTDALRMETELAKEEQMFEATARSRVAAAQTLNLILGRPLESEWPSLRLPEQALPVPVAVAEVARIPRVNPELRAMREMAAAADAGVKAAQKEKYPMVSVAVENQRYAASNDSISTTVGLKLTLPWFNNGAYEADISAAKARKAAADQDVEKMRRMLAERVSMLAAEAANAAAQARAFGGDIHDKASMAAKSAEAAWISSRVPLSDVLDASRVLYGIRLEQRRMIAMQLAALEELNTLVP